jgi:hypothetical protein
MQEHRFYLRDSEVSKSTRTLVRVSSARARGKRPPEVEDPTQLPLVLFIELKNYSYVYKLKTFGLKRLKVFSTNNKERQTG